MYLMVLFIYAREYKNGVRGKKKKRRGRGRVRRKGKKKKMKEEGG